MRSTSEGSAESVDESTQPGAGGNANKVSALFGAQRFGDENQRITALHASREPRNRESQGASDLPAALRAAQVRSRRVLTSGPARDNPRRGPGVTERHGLAARGRRI